MKNAEIVHKNIFGRFPFLFSHSSIDFLLFEWEPFSKLQIFGFLVDANFANKTNEHSKYVICDDDVNDTFCLCKNFSNAMNAINSEDAF